MKSNGYAGLVQGNQSAPEIGGLIGLLVGDALGVPYEFNAPDRLPPHEEIEMQPPTEFCRTYSSLPIGTWSDDGAQALCLLASLLDQNALSIEDFSERLVRWHEDGYMAVDNDVFDCGIQTSNAIHKLLMGVSPLGSGGKGERENGNGSLMRVLPLALWQQGSNTELVRDAHLQSLPTHAHPRSQAACAFYCLVARGYLNGVAKPWDYASSELAEIYACWKNTEEQTAFTAELDQLIAYPKTHEPRGTGYVLDCLWSAHAAMAGESYEDVVRRAILFGNDTDTTACVAGGLAGIRFGAAGIPQRWLMQLRGLELVMPLAVALAARRRSYSRKSNEPLKGDGGN